MTYFETKVIYLETQHPIIQHFPQHASQQEESNKITANFTSMHISYRIILDSPLGAIYLDWPLLSTNSFSLSNNTITRGTSVSSEYPSMASMPISQLCKKAGQNS